MRTTFANICLVLNALPQIALPHEEIRFLCLSILLFPFSCYMYVYISSNNRLSTNFALCSAYADILSTFIFGLKYALTMATGDVEVFTK